MRRHAHYNGPCWRCNATVTGDATADLTCLICGAKVMDGKAKPPLRCPRCGGSVEAVDGSAEKHRCTQCDKLVIQVIPKPSVDIDGGAIPRHAPDPMPQGPTAWRGSGPE